MVETDLALSVIGSIRLSRKKNVKVNLDSREPRPIDDTVTTEIIQQLSVLNYVKYDEPRFLSKSITTAEDNRNRLLIGCRKWHNLIMKSNLLFISRRWPSLEHSLGLESVGNFGDIIDKSVIIHGSLSTRTYSEGFGFISCDFIDYQSKRPAAKADQWASRSSVRIDQCHRGGVSPPSAAGPNR